MAIKFLNTVAVDTNVLYVDAINNRVGIGTNNPDAKLSVSDDGQAVFEITPFTNDYGTTLRSYDTVDEAFNYLSYKASIHTFYIGDAAKVRINGSGDVGIGTTSPGEKLSVDGNIFLQGSDDYIAFNTSASSGHPKIKMNSDADFSFLNTAGSNTFHIENGGNVGIGTTSPSRKLNVNGNVGINNQLLLDSANYNEHLSIRRGVYGYNTIVTGTRIDYSPTASTNTFKFLAALQTTGQLNVTGNAIVNGNVGIGTTSPNTKLDVISGTNGGIRISATDTTSNWRDIDIRSYVSQAQANALPDGSAIYTTNPTSQTETAFSKYGGTVIQGRDDGNSSFAIRLGNGGGYATRMFMGATGETTFSNTVQASGYKSSDGSAGITGTMTFVDHGSVTRTITYKNGLVVATS
jgi:hypothetical protein|tara:strand:- start:391 stop:1608 length:1218 start_codon:yes stop_codon:yes gene_type:complete